MKKLFTLIEMVVVIVILGILAAIVIPNVSNYKDNATQTAIASNKLNLQTAVDMYRIENNEEYPSIEQPALDSPSELDLDSLYPKYIKKKPKDNVKYSIDYEGKVYVSTAGYPENVIQEGGLVYWEDDDNAVSYNIYEYRADLSSQTSKPNKLVFVTKVHESKYEGVKGKRYAVSANDKYGNETAPTLSVYIEEQEQALQLNGIDQYLEINSIELMNVHNSGEVTYQVRYFFTGLRGTILHRGAATGYKDSTGCLYEPVIRTYHVLLSGCHETAKVVEFDSKLGWNEITVSISKEQGFVKVYRNGELLASKNTSELMSVTNRKDYIFNSEFTKLYLGATSGVKDNSLPTDEREPARTYLFRGKISELRIWNYGLSEEDISNHSKVELTGNESGLVGLWKFNEGSGDTVYDHTSNNHATIVNGGTWVK